VLNHISQSCKAAIVVEAALLARPKPTQRRCAIAFTGRPVAWKSSMPISAPLCVLSPGSVNSGGARGLFIFQLAN
jgi:hypothetical protein